MATRRQGSRSQEGHYGTSDGYHWSEWRLVPEINKEERYRINSRRERVYQYRAGPYVSDVPRATDSLSQSTSADGGLYQEYEHCDQDTQYHLSSQTTQTNNMLAFSTADPFNRTFQSTVFNDSSFREGSIASQFNDLQVSQPIAIAQSPSRTVYNTHTGGFAESNRENAVTDNIRGYAADMSNGTFASGSGRDFQIPSSYAQITFSNHGQQPVQPQYGQGINDEALLSSSMETVVPRNWGTMGGGQFSSGSLNSAIASFTSSSSPSSITGATMGASALFGIASQGPTSSIIGSGSSTQYGSGRNTPQPPMDSLVHKKITTLTQTTSKEILDPEFKVHKSSYFKPCHVFKVLWSEPEGETKKSDASANATVVTGTKFRPIEGKYGQGIYAGIRRFVIVAGDDGHCQCLPILTYGGQGTLKPGVKAKAHAIIYTKDPTMFEGEKLDLEPIKMDPNTHRDKLDRASRINYAKVYTVEHNVKVHFIGKIAKSSRRKFMTDFDSVWGGKRFQY